MALEPVRGGYSPPASVGKRQTLGSFCDSQAQKCVASVQQSHQSGWSGPSKYSDRSRSGWNPSNCLLVTSLDCSNRPVESFLAIKYNPKGRAPASPRWKLPKLITVEGAGEGFEYPLSNTSVMIGSSREADIRIRERAVSRFHARIEHSGGRYVLFDLDSAAGTFVNGKRVDNKFLSKGDRVKIGNTVLEFEDRAPDSRIGKALGKFSILARLGSGGMGSVYLAEQTDIDRLVALKVLKQTLTQNPDYVARFRREASTALGLIHKNIVQAYEVGCEDSTYFFSMEYINGPTLHDILKDERMFEPVRAIDVTVQVAEALDYASRVGIVHLDIKPSNILLTPSSLVKVADFGISRLAGEQIARADDDENKRKVVGSRFYIAPEQIRASTVDFRTDIYSLGATLYHMLAGRPPFMGAKGISVFKQHLAAPPRPLEELVPTVPRTLSAIVATMLLKRPDNRFRSLSELISALETCRKQLK